MMSAATTRWGLPQVSGAGGWALALIAGVTLWRLLCAWTVPVFKDEAYYFDWSSALAWGYFDHPPAVALLGIGAQWVPGSALAARAGAILVGALTLWLLWRLYLRCLRGHGERALLALLLAALTPIGLIGGVVTTPDTVLLLCWVLALHEAAAALDGERRRWLSAGIATGLGLLGKYTMLLIGPVFLWALLVTDPRALRTPWPYLGGLLALLVFLPNILWNAEHQWLTMRFQFGHGFAADTGPIQLPGEALPAPELRVAPTPESAEPAPTPMERVTVLASYLGSQLAFWGLLLVPILGSVPRWGHLPGRLRDGLSPAGRALLVAATVVPLAVFAPLSLNSDVEANWSAMYLVGAAGLLALLLEPRRRWVLAAAAANLLLASAYALHTATGLPPLPDAAQRAVREGGGFAALAEFAAAEPGPVFADHYQTTAMISFHQPGLEAGQWPGITRPSEYLLGRIRPIPSLDSLRSTGFSLILRRHYAPPIAGFRVVSAATVFDCGDGALHARDGEHGFEDGPCQRADRLWRVYRYQADDAAVLGGRAGAGTTVGQD